MHSLYRKTLTGFTPASKEAQAFYAATKLHQIVQLDGKRPRNPRRMRLWWGAMEKTAENIDGATKDMIHHKVMEVLGRGKTKTWRDGSTTFEPESIAFASMSEADFSELLNAALAVLARVLGVPVETLFEEVEQGL